MLWLYVNMPYRSCDNLHFPSMLSLYIHSCATPMQLLPYIADIRLVPRSGFHVDIVVIRGFAVDFKPVAFYIHATSNRSLILSAGLELLERQDPSCNTWALNEEILMGGHKAF